MTIKLYHKNKNGIFSINICFANPFCFLQNLPSTKQTKLSLNINIHPSSNSDLSLCLENYVHAHFLEDKFTCNMKVSVILHPHCSILLFFAAVNVIIVIIIVLFSITQESSYILSSYLFLNPISDGSPLKKKNK